MYILDNFRKGPFLPTFCCFHRSFSPSFAVFLYIRLLKILNLAFSEWMAYISLPPHAYAPHAYPCSKRQKRLSFEIFDQLRSAQIYRNDHQPFASISPIIFLTMAGWDDASLDALDTHLTENAGTPRASSKQGAASAAPAATPQKKKKKKVTRRMSMMSQ